MSLELLSKAQKCKNFYCKNQKDTRTKKRFVSDFCKRCQSTDNALFWPCARKECQNIIKGEIWSNRKYCSSYCRQAADYPNRNRRAFIKRIQNTTYVCRQCKGVFKRLPKRKNEVIAYCSDYCKWLNHIKYTSHGKALISVKQL